MADAVITDPTAKTVIYDGDNRRNSGPGWSAEPTFGQTAQAVHVANGDMHLLNSILTQFGFANRETAYQGSESRETTRSEGRFVDKEVSDGRRETATGFGRTDSLLEKGFGHIGEELAEGFGATNTRLERGFGEGRETVRVEACQTREVVKDRAADLQLAMATNTAAIQLEAAKNAAAAALAAATNTAAIQKSIADCCCEVKELVRAEAGATRDLINANTIQDLRDQRSAANAALLSLKAQVIL